LCAASVAAAAWDGPASELARTVRDAGLDEQECYRVRDLSIVKEDIRIFLTDGYLILSRAAGEHHVAAVFTAEVEGGDAEVLLFPPNRSERASMAAATGSPTLNEHFRQALFVFSDDTHDSLLKQIKVQGQPRRSQERGALLAEQWNPVLRNIVSSFEIRLVQDLLRRRRPDSGFFYAGLVGKTLGNFDVVYDPRSQEQVRIGKVGTRDGSAHFDVWTSFPARPYRLGQRYPASPSVTLSNFRIDATLQPDLTLMATTRLTLTPNEPGLRAIDFDLSRHVRVTEALLDGQPVEVFQRESMRANLIRGREDDVFLLVAPAGLEPGRGYEVEFRHEGAVILDAGNRVYFVGARDNWYPNRIYQFAEYDVTFRYPADLDLVTAGEVLEQKTEGEWSVTRRKTNSPVRFLGFNLGDYHTVQLTLNGYTVEVCANRALEPSLRPRAKRVVLAPRAVGWREPPGKAMPVPMEADLPEPGAHLERLASEIAAAFEFMSSHFGPPPLRRLTVSPIPGAFGQGFPGLVYLSTISYLDPSQRPQPAQKGFERVFFSEILHSHETAHQWWGNVVTSASYRDDWLMEALANYSALLYLERRSGAAALDAVLDQYKRNLLREVKSGRTVESLGPIVWGLRLQSAEDPAAWQVITYEKGSWIMHMLRRRMGDAQFLKMLGELRRRYEYKPVTTAQFRALAVEFLPTGDVDPSLEGFFEHWVYAIGIPTLEFRHTVTGKAPALKLTCTVTQSGSDEISVDVPVVIQIGRKSTTRWVRTGIEPVSFSMALRQKPQKVALDPTGSVLAVKK
jgi:hypothetical protein